MRETDAADARYSSLQSDLSTKIPRLRAQVRSLLCQADMAQHPDNDSYRVDRSLVKISDMALARREVDMMCSLINDNARQELPWSLRQVSAFLRFELAGGVVVADRIGKMNQWSRETLKSRVVQIRRHGEECRVQYLIFRNN